MPRVSGIDDACGISAHHMFLSNCVMQVMRVWSLPAVLSPLAKLHICYGVTQLAYFCWVNALGFLACASLNAYPRFSVELILNLIAVLQSC